MIFGLVSFIVVKLHATSSIIRSAIHRAMTGLIFVSEVGKLEVGMWLWGGNQLVLWVFLQWKNNLATFYLTCDHFRDMTQVILALNLVFIDKWPCRICKRCCPLTQKWTIKESPPHYMTLRSRESLILEPISTPSTTLISEISNFLVLIRNY